MLVRSTKVDAGDFKHGLLNRLRSTMAVNVLILSSHLSLGLPNGLFPSGFSTRTLCTTLSSPISPTCPPISFFSLFCNGTALTFMGEKVGYNCKRIFSKNRKNFKILFASNEFSKYLLVLGTDFYLSENELDPSFDANIRSLVLEFLCLL